MGGKNPERTRLWGRDSDPLAAYAHGYTLTARCRSPGCDNRRELDLARLLERFGPNATLAEVRLHFRCGRCGLHGARIEVRYQGWARGRS